MIVSPPGTSALREDLRASLLYRQAEVYFRAQARPSSGLISDALEVDVSPDGSTLVFSGVVWDGPEGKPSTRIFQIRQGAGKARLLGDEGLAARLARFAPSGELIAFLADAGGTGAYQLALMERDGRARPAVAPVEGWVEYFHWSPNGRQILLAVAGHGADISGGQGAVTSARLLPDRPDWMPKVETGAEDYRWRSIWIYCADSDSVRRVDLPGLNIWEAHWCGDDQIVAVCSQSPHEGGWYGASVWIIQPATGGASEVYRPSEQVGWVAGSPAGTRIAFVEAVCSDRWLVAGSLKLMDAATNSIREVASNGIDVTSLQWRSEDSLLVSGHRDFETAVGLYRPSEDRFTELWASAEVTGTARYMTVSGWGDAGDFAFAGEGFEQAPSIFVVRKGDCGLLESFDQADLSGSSPIGDVRQIDWEAPDGLLVTGWLVSPKHPAPHPTIMALHGGPVWHSRPSWIGRTRNIVNRMLLDRGYALFLPNPRGSAGRGQDFASGVVGDMGGADGDDCLTGLDRLVQLGLCDPERLGVMGLSYGGYLTAWLITQTDRFRAAVTIAPVTNFVTEHLTSNIPEFVSRFLKDHFKHQGGRYHSRSPVYFADRVRTPTLNICGSLDRCVPPTEAAQFYNALRENGVLTGLVTYPLEGHGVTRFPEMADYSARVVSWFDDHLGSS